MHIQITRWLFSQRDLRGKDLSQHCVLKAQLTNLFVFGKYLRLKLHYYLAGGTMPLQQMGINVGMPEKQYVH